MRVLVALLVVLALVPAAPATTPTFPPGLQDLVLTVQGETAHGRLAVPEGDPRGLVVLLHGYNHDADDHDAHLAHLADLGFVAVAMDYRGPKDGFPLLAGAQDTKAATELLLATYGFQHATLYSVSMGTAVAAILIPSMPGVFDVWVNNEGLSMLHETWAGAAALEPTGNPTAVRARAAIEEECGGTPNEHVQAYLARSAAFRAFQFVGLKAVILVHDVNDGLVPHNQGREMEAALANQGIPTDFYTVLRGDPGHEGTSLTGYAGQEVDGLAGHGDESDDRQATTKVSFALLDRVVTGQYPLPTGHHQFVVDRELGEIP